MLGLKACRLSILFSQEQLANKVGAHVSNYRKWEAGEALPTIDTVKRLAQILGVQPWQLWHPKPIEAAAEQNLGYHLRLNWRLNDEGEPNEASLTPAITRDANQREQWMSSVRLQFGRMMERQSMERLAG